jgi:quinol monooxygenase YgiN
MIHVIAVITAKPGRREAILQAFRANVPAVHAEKGCFIEKWDGMDALKAHAAAPHMAAYGAKTRDLIASRVIHILSPA